jgi:putative peptide zinc metalloprotease protein
LTPTPLRFNPAIQVWPFDGAAREKMSMCEIPRADGSLARFALPDRLLGVIRGFDGERATGEVARAGAAAGACSEEELARLVSGFLVPNGFLVADGEEAGSPVQRANRLTYMTLKVRLLPPAVVTPVARCLGWLYSRWIMAAVGTAFVIAQFVFFLKLAPGHEMGFAALKGSHAGAIVLLMMLSTLIHEFGHAAAAARHGCRRLEIGWGLYYHISVLYTDLSEAWRLTRRQRALVDVGGMYFQAIFALGFLAVYRVTHSVVPLYCFLATDLAIGASLNPFFRMDGYWLASDLLGVPNLHVQSARLLRRMGLRLVGRRDPDTQPLALGRGAMAFMATYSVLGLAFFVFAFQFAVNRLLAGLAVTYPAVLRGFWTAATAHPVALGAVGSAAFAVLWRGLVLFGTAKLLYNFGKRVVMGALTLGKALVRALRRPRASLAGLEQA